MTPRALLSAARRLVSEPEAATRFVWALAATHLTRQALEDLLDRLWTLRRVPGLARAPMRDQLVCLPRYLSDRALAERAAWTWVALSDAGHHRGLEGAPSATDLAAWIAMVEELGAAVGDV